MCVSRSRKEKYGKAMAGFCAVTIENGTALSSKETLCLVRTTSWASTEQFFCIRIHLESLGMSLGLLRKGTAKLDCRVQEV